MEWEDGVKKQSENNEETQEAFLVKDSENKVLLNIQKMENEKIRNELIEIKKIQYELRRIELLMRVYDDLTKIKNYKLLEIRLCIMKICFLKYTEVFQTQFSHKKSLMKNLQNPEFKKELDQRYVYVDQEAQKNAGGFFIKYFKRNLNEVIGIHELESACRAIQ